MDYWRVGRYERVNKRYVWVYGYNGASIRVLICSSPLSSCKLSLIHNVIGNIGGEGCLSAGKQEALQGYFQLGFGFRNVFTDYYNVGQ